jgi:hypothetical protein
VQIATQHPEAVGKRARVRMKERLLFDRIALHAADVSPRNAQRSAFVEADLAHPDSAVRQGTAVAARVAAQTAVREHVVQRPFPCFVRQDVGQCRHDETSIYCTGEED